MSQGSLLWRRSASLGVALCVVLGALAVSLVPLRAAQKPNSDLELQGRAVQGGLMLGATRPGAKVWLGDKKVPVAPGGMFLLGFGRKAGAKIELRITLPGGGKVRRQLRVVQRRYDIQRIDGLAPSKVTPSAAALKRIKAERRLITKARRRFSLESFSGTAFSWPLRGRISGVYGSQRVLNGKPRAPHLGVDIAAPKGTPILAPAAATVALAHDGMFFSGKLVILDHGLGLTSVYAHMSRLAVKAGDRVKRGDVIGAVGATGRVTGPHLHWGVHLFGLGLDPQLLSASPSVGPAPVHP